MSAPSQAQPSTSAVTQQTFSVRMPRDVKTTKKKYSVLKFDTNPQNPTRDVDFAKCSSAKIERENNLKAFKSAYDIETAPKFGAGSEYGRDQREEARKKKFGQRARTYNSDDQPWLLKIGTPPQRFKGTRNGGILENASYYIFMQCSDGKAFEAYPVQEWYNFQTIQTKYKCLDSEEAEEEFSRREKTVNYFSIMMRKRIKNADGSTEDADESEKGPAKSKKKSSKSLVISEFDDMSNSSDDEAGSSSGEEGKPKKKQKQKAKKETRASKKKKKAEDEGEEDEALEESDEMDEGEEVDYMSGSSSDDETMYDDKGRDESEKYKDQGVEDEEGLRKIVESGDEEDEDEEKKEDENEDDEENRVKDAKDNNSESESSSDSDSDSDPEKEGNFASPLFMTQEKRQSTKQEQSNSRPSTPSNTPAAETAKKRKAENQSPVPASKKIKAESSSTAQPSTSSGLATTLPLGSNDGISEDAVRRYLMRKPMTTKELVQKFKSRNAGMSKEQMTMTIAQILKKLNPLQKKINGVMTLYLSTSTKSEAK